MKTAISLSDSLFEIAEQTAQYMGVNRSQLYALALEDYVARHNGSIVTEKLNEVYEKINQNEFARDLDAGLEPLRNLTKDDAW
jgi:metal-responsive CopG/Arc/MetJ family transcriptional regulator